MAMESSLIEADYQSRAGMLGEHITSLAERFRRELAPMVKILLVIMARFKFRPREASLLKQLRNFATS